MGEKKKSRRISGWLIIIAGIIVSILIVSGVLLVRRDGEDVTSGTIFLICGGFLLLLFPFMYSSLRDDFGFFRKKSDYTYYAGVWVAEDKLDRFGERTVRASGIRLPKRLGIDVFIDLFARAESKGGVKWALHLRAEAGVGEIPIDAQMLFKTAAGEIIEIRQSVEGAVGGTEHRYYGGYITGVIAQNGIYYIAPDILDALCGKELVKIRIISTYSPLDIDVTGCNITKFFGDSRNEIEKALATEKTVYLGF